MFLKLIFTEVDLWIEFHTEDNYEVMRLTSVREKGIETVDDWEKRIREALNDIIIPKLAAEYKARIKALIYTPEEN